MSNIDFNDILRIQTKNESLLELYRGGHKLWNSELDFIKFGKLTYKDTEYLSPSIINNEYCIIDWKTQEIHINGLSVTITYSLFIIKNNKNAEILTLFIPSNIYKWKYVSKIYDKSIKHFRGCKYFYNKIVLFNRDTWSRKFSTKGNDSYIRNRF